MTVRLGSTRRAGRALVAFGAAGIGLLLAAAALLVGSLAAVDDAVTGFEHQRTELVALLEPASTALADAAGAASRAGSSLTEASAAADRAAGLTTSLADSFDGLASLGAFEVLGARPFAGLSESFRSVGADARVLTTSLRTTAASMRTNAGDSAAVATDLRLLATQLEALTASIGGATDSTGAGATHDAAASAAASIGLARLVLLGLLAWLAVPAIASAWLGWRMLRSRSP